MATTLERLIDESDIRQAMARYSRGIDRMDRDLIASAYWPGAQDIHGPYHGSVEGFLDWIMELLPRDRCTSHQLGQSLIAFDGDQAAVETYFTANHVRDLPERSVLFVIVGRYSDRFEKRGGQWRIADRVVSVDFRRNHELERPGTEMASTPVSYPANGRRSPDDPTDALYEKIPIPGI